MVGKCNLTFDVQKKIGCFVADRQIRGAFGSYTLLGKFGNGTQSSTEHCESEEGERFVIKFFVLSRKYGVFNDAKRIQVDSFSAELTAHEIFFRTGIEKVPKIRDTGRTLTGSIPFIVMERLGPNLNVMLKASGYLYFTIRSALKLVYQLILCLEAIHSVNIVHRDIKPENFCFSYSPTNGQLILKIIDFGCSKVYDPASIAPLLDEGCYSSIGTTGFSSRAAHLTSTLCPYDDLESLFYLITSFFRGQKLDWAEDRFRSLKALFRDKTDLWECKAFGCAPLNAIFKHIKGLKREDNIQYDKLKNVILEQFGQLISEQDEDSLVAICGSGRRTITEQLNKHY